MDTENPPKTITGSLVQRPLERKSEPTKSEQKLFSLLRLGGHYWPHDFTPSQAKAFLADYLDDLYGLSPQEVETVCGEWRRNADNTRFPRSGEILRMASENRGPTERPRTQTFKGYGDIEGPRATKSVAEILREHGQTHAAERWNSRQEKA